MTNKAKSIKIILLSLAALALLAALCLQTFRIHRLFKGLGRPTLESRELGSHSLHSWMTPEELARRYAIPISLVFEDLGIKPEPGDDKLPLQQLRSKHHKSREDMRIGLMQLERRGQQNGCTP